MFLITSLTLPLAGEKKGIKYLHNYCCKKGDPFHGPKLGSYLTLGNELSEETHVLKKQETLLGRGNWMESSRVMEPGRTALASSLRFFGDGVSFRVVSGQSFGLRVLSGSVCTP